jgi:hypothetical protein
MFVNHFGMDLGELNDTILTLQQTEEFVWLVKLLASSGGRVTEVKVVGNMINVELIQMKEMSLPVLNMSLRFLDRILSREESLS